MSSWLKIKNQNFFLIFFFSIEIFVCLILLWLWLYTKAILIIENNKSLCIEIHFFIFVSN